MASGAGECDMTATYYVIYGNERRATVSLGCEEWDLSIDAMAVGGRRARSVFA